MQHNDALPLERPERLANRLATHIELRSDGVLAQPGANRNTTVDDLATQLVRDLIRDRLL
jgi:hypothetical protein